MWLSSPHFLCQVDNTDCKALAILPWLKILNPPLRPLTTNSSLVLLEKVRKISTNHHSQEVNQQVIHHKTISENLLWRQTNTQNDKTKQKRKIKSFATIYLHIREKLLNKYNKFCVMQSKKKSPTPMVCI